MLQIETESDLQYRVEAKVMLHCCSPGQGHFQRGLVSTFCKAQQKHCQNPIRNCPKIYNNCAGSAVELKHCKSLRKITLENNRLATPVMDLRAMSCLKSLQLFGNPLEYLPELSPCTELRHLSLANVRPIRNSALIQSLHVAGFCTKLQDEIFMSYKYCHYSTFLFFAEIIQQVTGQRQLWLDKTRDKVLINSFWIGHLSLFQCSTYWAEKRILLLSLPEKMQSEGALTSLWKTTCRQSVAHERFLRIFHQIISV